ncbi:MAG: NAD(P)H-dependent oxidoreductase [Planctomycetota bacterium]
MKCTAFAASTSSTSINKQLVNAAASLLRGQRPEASVDVLDLRDYPMPMFSEDQQREHGIPDAAVRFLGGVSACDALIISFAEHNGGYTAAYKNAFDWMSRISQRVFEGKRVVALSTSPGKRGGASVLESFIRSAPHFGAEVVASLPVPVFHEAYDRAAGALAPEWEAKLAEAVRAL